MTNTHPSDLVPNSIRVHFHAANLDHEIGLPETFVRSLPSVEVRFTRESTVDQVVSRAIAIHAQSGAAEWTGREAEALVFFGGMGSSHDDYFGLGWHLYGVDDAGHLVVYDTTEDAILLGVLRALEHKYFGPAPQDPLVVVTLGAGWGGNGALVVDMLGWLGDVAPEVIVAYLATKALDHLPNAKEAKLRSLADSWARQNIDSPFVLRRWIQSKPSWQVSEVAKRLELNEQAARELLLALGYEDAGRGVLELKSSTDALARRDLWIIQETSGFEKSMKELADPHPRTRLRPWLSGWFARRSR